MKEKYCLDCGELYDDDGFCRYQYCAEVTFLRKEDWHVSRVSREEHGKRLLGLTMSEKVGQWLGRLFFGIGIGCIYSWSPPLAIGWLAFALIGKENP